MKILKNNASQSKSAILDKLTSTKPTGQIIDMSDITLKRTLSFEQQESFTDRVWLKKFKYAGVMASQMRNTLIDIDMIRYIAIRHLEKHF